MPLTLFLLLQSKGSRSYRKVHAEELVPSSGDETSSDKKDKKELFTKPERQSPSSRSSRRSSLEKASPGSSRTRRDSRDSSKESRSSEGLRAELRIIPGETWFSA